MSLVVFLALMNLAEPNASTITPPPITRTVPSADPGRVYACTGIAMVDAERSYDAEPKTRAVTYWMPRATAVIWQAGAKSADINAKLAKLQAQAEARPKDAAYQADRASCIAEATPVAAPAPAK
jgi:hypothetical protein